MLLRQSRALKSDGLVVVQRAVPLTLLEGILVHESGVAALSLLKNYLERQFPPFRARQLSVFDARNASPNDYDHVHEWHRDRQPWRKTEYGFMLPLGRFSSSTGATEFIAGSHRFPFRKNEIIIPAADIGDIVLFNLAIRHRRPLAAYTYQRHLVLGTLRYK